MGEIALAEKIVLIVMNKYGRAQTKDAFTPMIVINESVSHRPTDRQTDTDGQSLL